MSRTAEMSTLESWETVWEFFTKTPKSNVLENCDRMHCYGEKISSICKIYFLVDRIDYAKTTGHSKIRGFLLCHVKSAKNNPQFVTYSPSVMKQWRKPAAESLEWDQANTQKEYLHWHLESLEVPINRVTHRLNLVAEEILVFLKKNFNNCKKAIRTVRWWRNFVLIYNVKWLS